MLLKFSNFCVNISRREIDIGKDYYMRAADHVIWGIQDTPSSARRHRSGLAPKVRHPRRSFPETFAATLTLARYRSQAASSRILKAYSLISNRNSTGFKISRISMVEKEKTTF